MRKELQEIKMNSFNEWFKENYKLEEWQEKVKQSASKGYSALTINLTENIKSEHQWLMLNNPYFLENMKSMFPDLDVTIKKYQKKEFRITITGNYWENVEHKRLVIDWSDDNE